VNSAGFAPSRSLHRIFKPFSLNEPNLNEKSPYPRFNENEEIKIWYRLGVSFGTDEGEKRSKPWPIEITTQTNYMTDADLMVVTFAHWDSLSFPLLRELNWTGLTFYIGLSRHCLLTNGKEEALLLEWRRTATLVSRNWPRTVRKKRVWGATVQRLGEMIRSSFGRPHGPGYAHFSRWPSSLPRGGSLFSMLMETKVRQKRIIGKNRKYARGDIWNLLIEVTILFCFLRFFAMNRAFNELI